MRSTLVALAVLLLPASASAFQVRADRPRLMLSNGNGFGTSLETFKQRCTSDPAYMQRCQGALANGGGLFPAANRAAAYLVSGDPARCGEAFTEAQAISQDQPGQPDGHAFISNNGRTLLQVAMVRDWCDAALDGEQKQWLEDRIVTYADWYIANDGANEVFGNDIYNVWNAVAFAGLSLAGTAQDQKAQSYLTAADAKWKTVIFPSLAHSGDWWPEGMTYVQPAIASTVWYAAAWSTATDEDIFAWAKTNAKDIYNGYIHFHAYATRPDSHYAYFGDTSDSKQSVALFSRYLVDMLTLGTKSPLGQAFSLEIEQMVDKYYDYSGADGWLMAILRDAAQDGSATPRSTLPTARWHGQGSNDVAILRSGWGKADTFVMLSCGDYLSAHQHYEAGSFQIFRHSQLTGTTGYYDAFDTDHWLNYYSQHSVHANVLSVYQPGEFFPTLQSLGDPSQNVNDGGQRVLRRDQNGTASPQPDLPTYLSQLDAPPYKNTGDIQTFEHTVDCHDYVACDVTAAYTSPGHETNGNTAKVNEVTRQFVFIKPDIIVVFDRVESTDPSYDKRFLLHALGAPDVQGNTYTITNGPGRLIGKTLLPADPEVSVINNFEVEGKAHPPQNAGKESGGTRLEISPKTEGARDYFLHVLRATDSADSAAPNATATEDDKNIILTLEHGGESWTVTFAKTGDLGGYIKAVSGGQTLCDQALGEFATIPNDGGAGGAGGSGGNGGSGANGADSGEEGGCGCRIDGHDAGGSAALLGAALAGLALHRRRRARAPQA